MTVVFCGVSIEVEVWRSEGISAKGFIVMLVFSKVVELGIANFTAVRRASARQSRIAFAPEGFHLDRRATVNNLR